LGVVLLVTIAVAWLLAADVQRAVAHLNGEVTRLASGDLRPSRPHFWEDELGGLASGLEHMAQSLGGMIVGVRATADRVEAAAGGIGQASRRLLETSEDQVHGNDALRESILGVTGQVSGIRESAGELTASVEEGSSSILQLRGAGQQLDDNASLLSEKVDEVSSSVDELIRSVRDVLEHAEHLSGAAVDTSSSMEEMAASLREMDTNATETARLSDHVVERAEDGRAKVHETLKGMEQIRETTSVAQSVIHGLGGRAKEIGAIVEVIDDVAEETNLLALNAAIIAAQAGENGRSFSVVADEIKKLADRVLSSTKEIEQVIGSVQSETANAITAIERGSRVVEVGVARADEAGGALERITEAARDSGSRIGEIVSAVTEQTKAAAHVVGLMERVRAGVDHIRRAGQEQDRGNESMLASTEVMREIAQRVRGTTREQAQGSGRIAAGVAAVSAAVDRINTALARQSGACDTAEGELGATEARTRAHGQLAQELDGAVGRMRDSATELREAVERFRV
ncbi:MAG TPA: methyl-accepting chemotaxis protein, partial [Myxococcota bacterium]|nr:methyl-accepting chemotaxis protein [Myxococcota bacterium]